jgi:hypothetical protein
MMNASDLRPLRDDITTLQQEIINLQSKVILLTDRVMKLEYDAYHQAMNQAVRNSQ